jgi:hypothetical protein
MVRIHFGFRDPGAFHQSQELSINARLAFPFDVVEEGCFAIKLD